MNIDLRDLNLTGACDRALSSTVRQPFPEEPGSTSAPSLPILPRGRPPDGTPRAEHGTVPGDRPALSGTDGEARGHSGTGGRSQVTGSARGPDDTPGTAQW